MTDQAGQADVAAPDAQGFLPRPGSLSYRRLSLAAILALPLFFFTINFNIIRQFSSLSLLAALALAGLICMIARRIEISRSYLVFASFATAIFAASLLGLMPDAWTQHHDNIAAVRHWLWIPALPVVTTAFVILFGRLQHMIIRRALAIAAGILIWVVATGQLFELDYGFFLYEIDNHKLPVTAALILFLFRTRRDPRIDLALILGYLLISQSASQQMLAVAMLAIRFTPREHWVVIAVGLTVAAALVLAPYFAADLDRIDANTGVRAVMWGDAIDAAVDTNGVGVGFGTEYIRNQFYAIRAGDWRVADPNHEGFLFLSTHSTFFDVLLRLGLAGLVLSVIWIVSLILPRQRLSRQNRKAHAALACAFLIFSAFNPALISFNTLFGSAVLLAWMHLLQYQPALMSQAVKSRR